MTSSSPSLNQVILLVDDDPNDRFLVRRAFEKLGIQNPLVEVTDGQAAIAYLAGERPYDDRTKYPFPGIILLDLQMPRVDGLAVLEWIRSTIVQPGLLIIVLSRLDEIRQVNRAYALGANSFLTKPGTEQDLFHLIAAFRDYWIVRNKPAAPQMPPPKNNPPEGELEAGV
ncbi:MAG TPA: response regulator [Verrucomicrobiae bacterium]|nr:response regulator [Verrucomicrobiae bacterium]